MGASMGGRQLPNGTWVVVANGTRAIIYRDQGEGVRLDLRVEDVFSQGGRRIAVPGPVGPNFLHEIGRTPPSANGAALPTDLASAIGAELTRARRRGLYEALVLIAPPRMLGSLRAALCPTVAATLIGVLLKDLVRTDVETVEAHLMTMDGPAQTQATVPAGCAST